MQLLDRTVTIPGDTRAARFHHLTHMYFGDTRLPDGLLDACLVPGRVDDRVICTWRYLLLERNTRGCEPEVWMSTHDSPGDAAAAWMRDERREDWEPVALVDLDTGGVYDATPTVVFAGAPAGPPPSGPDSLSAAAFQTVLAAITAGVEHDITGLPAAAAFIEQLIAVINDPDDPPEERFHFSDVWKAGWLLLHWAGIPADDRAQIDSFIEALGSSSVPDACATISAEMD